VGMLFFLLITAPAGGVPTSDGAAGVAYLHADLRTPQQILTDPDLAGTLDLDRPVALLLVAVLHFLSDTDQPHTVVRTLLDALPAGSFLVISHASYDLLPARTAEAFTAAAVPGLGSFTPRTREQIDRFFDGLIMLPPGLQVISQWRPEPGTPLLSPQQVAVYGAVARKPT
jgi:hypothetical protein